MGNQTFCMAFFLAHLSPLSAPLGAAISGSKMLGVRIVSDRLNFALLDVPIWTPSCIDPTCRQNNCSKAIDMTFQENTRRESIFDLRL